MSSEGRALARWVTEMRSRDQRNERLFVKGSVWRRSLRPPKIAVWSLVPGLRPLDQKVEKMGAMMKKPHTSVRLVKYPEEANS